MAGTKLTLSRLAYEIVRDSFVMPSSTELSYEAFCNKDYNRVNSDWTMQIRKVFPTINKAMARLAQYNKLPYFTKEFEIIRDNNLNAYIDISNLDYSVVKNVYHMIYGGRGDWANFGFRINGDKLYLADAYPYTSVMVEYLKEVPNFTEDDIVPITCEYDADEVVQDKNIDLATEYGISGIIFQILKSYACALITAEIDQEKGNNELIYTENLLADLETVKPSFNQRKINQSIRMKRW